MGENVYSGGFAIDSALMREGLSAMKTIKSQEGGSTFEGIFGKNYAVPPMWFLSPYDSVLTQDLKTGGSRENLNNVDSEIIEEDLHDKLLNILEGTRKEKKKTAKLREKRKRSTKRNAN